MATNAMEIVRLCMDADLIELLSKPTLSVVEAGKLLGLSRGGAYEAARRGEIPTLQFGARLRVPTVRIIEMLGVSQ